MRELDVRRLASETVSWDAVVLGSGVAGLAAALGLGARRVLIVTKSTLAGGGSSPWAQGGVAAALARDDSPSQHARDTLAASAGLGDRAVVEILTREGPARVRALMALGGQFDRGDDGRLLFGREGAHGRRRILHADGDATGREMMRALSQAVRASGVVLAEKTFARDLVVAGDRVCGVLALTPGGRQVFHRAPAVILATGGCGQLYRWTTNPAESTGDGLAMAARAGALLADLELVQFHPTALAAGRDPLPLVSEAVRGEGATLVDEAGERFLMGLHPRAELAPRDVVARAIFVRQQAGGRIFLDAREALGNDFPRRFPTVYAHCRRAGVDPRHELVPVTPAAHFTMGGVAVDAWGRASLAGLWACGEVASNGVHGANRLASNSLLEALVFGARVADDVGAKLSAATPVPASGTVRRELAVAVGEPVRRRLRELMWERVGLVRERRGLERALEEIELLAASGVAPAEPRELESGNLLTVGRAVAAAALWREESRGAHFRSDFPQPRERFARRLIWRYEPLSPRPLPSSPSLPEVATVPPVREVA